MSERSAVQNPMLRYAEEIGWEYVPPAEALRRREGAGGRFFVEELAAQLQWLLIDPAARRGMGARARARAQELDWRRQYHALRIALDATDVAPMPEGS